MRTPNDDQGSTAYLTPSSMTQTISHWSITPSQAIRGYRMSDQGGANASVLSALDKMSPTVRPWRASDTGSGGRSGARTPNTPNTPNTPDTPGSWGAGAGFGPSLLSSQPLTSYPGHTVSQPGSRPGSDRSLGLGLGAKLVHSHSMSGLAPSSERGLGLGGHAMHSQSMSGASPASERGLRLGGHAIHTLSHPGTGASSERSQSTGGQLLYSQSTSGAGTGPERALGLGGHPLALGRGMEGASGMLRRVGSSSGNGGGGILGSLAASGVGGAGGMDSGAVALASVGSTSTKALHQPQPPSVPPTRLFMTAWPGTVAAPSPGADPTSKVGVNAAGVGLASGQGQGFGGHALMQQLPYPSTASGGGGSGLPQFGAELRRSINSRGGPLSGAGTVSTVQQGAPPSATAGPVPVLAQGLVQAGFLQGMPQMAPGMQQAMPQGVHQVSGLPGAGSGPLLTAGGGGVLQGMAVPVAREIAVNTDPQLKFLYHPNRV